MVSVDLKQKERIEIYKTKLLIIFMLYYLKPLPQTEKFHNAQGVRDSDTQKSSVRFRYDQDKCVL